EVPAVVFDIQRVGPSTGLPTRTAQGDVLFAATLSHGDTKNICLYPGSVLECFQFAGKAFDVAERFQTPVFVLSDLDLGMNFYMADPFPYPDGFFRSVICGELIEHLQRDPLHMLWEINRVLADNGYLLLTTPNIASARAIEGLLVGCTPYLFPQYNLLEVVDQHNREYAPYEIGVALAAAGFSVVALETEDVWLRSNPAILELLREIQISAELRGDNIFALARKVSPPIERHPAELYTDR
ncbi:MAG: methyltransferase domain-containing protein, partial [Acidobacteriota bacterium]